MRTSSKRTEEGLDFTFHMTELDITQAPRKAQIVSSLVTNLNCREDQIIEKANELVEKNNTLQEELNTLRSS